MNCENVIILTNIVRNSFRIGPPEAYKTWQPTEEAA